MKNEESAGQKPSESPLNEQLPSLLALLGALTQSLQMQTEAINRLAASNEALVEAMVEGDPDVDELVQRHLDGSPVL